MSGRDTSFYYSFLVLPADRRKAIVAVWDFCRAVDDAVDEPKEGLSPCDELARWRKEISLCFDGGRPETGQGRELQPYVRELGLPRDAFERVIEGVEMDLKRQNYQTFDELREYCLRVASAVGHICIAIFGCSDKAAHDYATDLGIALQMTNIIRDVGNDLSRGRVYLPVEDLDRFGCPVDTLRAGVVSEPVRRLLSFECERTRSYYASAERLLASTDRRRLVAARIMAGIYSAILTRIERRGYDVFSAVVRVPRPRRAVIAATIWAKTLLGS